MLLLTMLMIQLLNVAHSFRSSSPLIFRYTKPSSFLSSTISATTNPVQSKSTKVIVVTGGVISGIGKGITASSIGVVLKMLGLKPTAMKIDPYLNVDAGTMSPFEHGETFVLDDGAETDLDLGNYERFLDVKLTNESSLTTGKIYQSVIAKERRGDYLGKTVQIIPHITDEIMARIQAVGRNGVDESASQPDVCIVELGGTIGDIESMPFVEAIRQLQLKLRPVNLCIVHVSMVPTVGEDGEQKTKPTQHSVKELRSLGLAPDFIVCRSKLPLDKHSRTKISLFCNVPTDNVLSMHDLSNIYQAPLVMMQQNFHSLLIDRLGLTLPVTPSTTSTTTSVSSDDNNKSDSDSVIDKDTQKLLEGNKFYDSWKDMTLRMDTISDEVIIAVIGKYTNLGDSYTSLLNAIKHSCVATGQKLKLVMVESSHLESEVATQLPEIYSAAWDKVKCADAVVVPGGFGVRGIEGKIEAIKFVRENKIPFLGVCLGMQMAVIEYCRNLLNMPEANSEEFISNPRTPHDSAIMFMPEGNKEALGGTMRLGSRTTVLRPGTIASQLYNHAAQVDERHRHRYEVNPDLVNLLEEKGLIFSGKDTTGQRMEVIELNSKTHPYFVGVQFHPEYKSRPLRPAPVFLGLLQAVQKQKQKRGRGNKL